MLRFFWAACVAVVYTLTASAAESQKYLSHPPPRPLPVVSNRPMDKGPAFAVDPAKGDNANDGSPAKPWRTLVHAFAQLKAGDTLYLRGGIYFEHATLTSSGTADKPITIRSHPGELAIVDGGLREFFESSATAWEPCPDGVEGEFWSTKTYPDLGDDADGTNVLGRFADSLVPLHGYRFRTDLQTKNMFWNLNNKVGGEGAIYCGPGIFYDVKTGRIHIRLAHTTLKGLHDDNYRGETDPRKLPLVIAGFAGGPPLTLRGAKHVRVQDLVVRGSRVAAIEVSDGENIEFDGLSVYGGSTAFQVRDTIGLRVVHTACRGIAAPWTFRGSLKYRAIEARIFSASGWNPTGADNRDFELAYSEFTDCVDGVFIGSVRNVKFHHNLLDNVSDDGIFLTATTAYDGTTPGGNVQIYQNLLSRCLTTFAFGVGHGRQKTIATGRQTGAGVHICRNVFDYRRPVMYHQPTSPEGEQEITSMGRVASDHGSPLWEPMNIYHNTILADDAPRYTYGTAGLGNSIGRGTNRRVFNNILVQMKELPGITLPPAATDLQADGNLFWSLSARPMVQGDSFGKFRTSKVFEESKTQYPPGWTAGDRFADPKFARISADWKAAVDLSLPRESPAIDAGVPIPAAWPDPLRATDQGKPDLGALPVGAEPWHVGVRGRLTMFGEERPPGKLPALEPFQYSPRPAAPEHKPAAIQQGYPAFDAPYVQFALRRRQVPIEVFDKSWLDPKDYGKYGVVVIVGSLLRAKIEPRFYSKENFERVKKYLEDGGTLVLMRVGADVFATPQGRELLAGLTGTAPQETDPQLQLLKPDHPWVKHLDPKGSYPWMTSKLATPWRTSKGEVLIGTATGQATLYRLPVGKGQLIYLGWEISTSMPTEANATLEQEKAFEEQISILLNLVADLYPQKPGN